MAALSKEIATYKRMRPILETDHFGKWVLVHDEVLVDAFDSFETATETAIEQFGRGPYLIRQVGAPPLRLPASLLYRTTAGTNLTTPS